MGFVSIDSWDARDELYGRADGVARQRVHASSRLTEKWMDAGRKSGASVLSILIHVLLLWVFLYKLVGTPGSTTGPGGEGEGMTLIDLAGSAASAPAARPTKQSQQQSRSEATAAIQNSELDTTKATELTPEWSVARIAVRREAAAPPAPVQTSSAAAAAAAAGAGASAAAGGGGGGEIPYDPYAGAAPMRRERPALSAPKLNQPLLDAIVRQVTATMPHADGTAHLSVRVAADGRIVEVSTGSGSAQPAAMAALRQALLGKQLFSASGARAPTIIELPEINL